MHAGKCSPPTSRRSNSSGLKAYDDGRLDEALKHLNEATAIDKDFKLASLTLEEYERLAAQVRVKAEAAEHVVFVKQLADAALGRARGGAGRSR